MTRSGFHVHWPPLGLALILALLGMWLNQVAERPVMVDDSGFTHEPDYIVENFDAMAFDLRGRPRHRLVAERMMHYMDDDTTVLEQPVLVSLDPEIPMEVRSRRAQMSADGKQVYFLNQVHVLRRGMNGEMPMTLDTEYLHVTPDDRIMRTDKFVTLRQGASLISANQMLVDDVNKLLTLSAGVKGTHQVSHSGTR
ncbi:MAG: LPS export ABC transporter periplasmic protein LptC [Hydrogenophilales bacterium 28-61-23]|nr:MAG: LPS export ABC transporter periplasmic protein LptC [Hydrogenophilales bacterium 28-61-23]